MTIDLGRILELAADAARAVGSAQALFDRLRALFDRGELSAEAALQVGQLAMELGHAHAKLSSLKSEIAALQNEIAELQRAQESVDRIEQLKRNYERAETPMGELVYRYQADAGTGDIPHEVCPACFEDDKVRTLQPRGSILECLNCKAQIRNKPDLGPQIIHRRDPFEGY